jgi:ribonucleoside-triphosphate reductase
METCKIMQSPFVTLFMHLKDEDPYIEENAMIFEELLKQRYLGIKNEKGVYITPAFPRNWGPSIVMY